MADDVSKTDADPCPKCGTNRNSPFPCECAAPVRCDAVTEEALTTGIVDAFNEADFAIVYREVEDSGTTSMQEIYNVPTGYCRLIAAALASPPPSGVREALERDCEADFYALWCDKCNNHPSKCPHRATLSQLPATDEAGRK